MFLGIKYTLQQVLDPSSCPGFGLQYFMYYMWIFGFQTLLYERYMIQYLLVTDIYHEMFAVAQARHDPGHPSYELRMTQQKHAAVHVASIVM